MKKRSILALMAAGTMAIALVGCNPAPEQANGGTVSVMNAELSASAFQSFGDFAQMQGFESVSTMSMTDTAAETVVETPQDTFEKYMAMFDKKVESTLEDNKDEDYTDYAKKLVIEGVSIGGESEKYVLYYNETNQKETTDDEEAEMSYDLNGVMVSGETTYTLSGTYEKETEGTEVEEEFTLRASASSLDYIEMTVKMEQEGSELEDKYTYKSIVDGLVVDKLEIEYETESEDGNSENSIEIKTENANGTVEYEVEQEIDKDGNMTLKVESTENGVKTYFKAYKDATTGEVVLVDTDSMFEDDDDND